MTKPVDAVVPTVAAGVSKSFDATCGHSSSLARRKALDALYRTSPDARDAIYDYIDELEATNRALHYELEDAHADLRHHRRQY